MARQSVGFHARERQGLAGLHELQGGGRSLRLRGDEQGLVVGRHRRRGLRVESLDVRNSGDTAGPRDRVVGYGAYAVR